MSDIGNQPANRPISISTSEFDRKVEAGEDVDDHFDWENAVVVEPGELSPGQKWSMIQTLLADLLAANHLASPFLLGHEVLSIPVSPLTLTQIWKEAVQRKISREAVVQSWIEQKVEEQMALK